MDIGVVGISYQSSDLPTRERFAVECGRWIRSNPSVPVVLLSTCNRTEIYFSSRLIGQTYSDLLFCLGKKAGGDIEQKTYAYFSEHCFIHLAKVTSGLDSIIFGESEIRRQVKEAYEEACSRTKIPAPLHYLFQKSLKIGKEIRTEFALPVGSISIESIVRDLYRLFFSGEKTPSALFVGYSKINRNILRFLQSEKGIRFHLATGREAAVPPEERDLFSLLPWNRIALWSAFDMVICGSRSSDSILTPDQLPTDGSSVRTKLVIDLGLPRNVDPSIAKNPFLTLFNIEQVGKMIDHKKRVSSVMQRLVEDKVEQIGFRQVSLYEGRREKVAACI